MPPLKIAIVADIRLYREGLADVLNRHDGLTVVATAASCDCTRAVLPELNPEVVLVDMGLPDGLAAIRSITTALPEAKVVCLGVGEDDRAVLACAEAGAVGYVPREGSLNDLLAVIESVARGEAVCSPRIAAALLRRVASLAAHRAVNQSPASLTSREREIVRLIDAGLSNKDIARRLCIEVATVKNHVHNVLEKLHLHRRSEAAAHLRGTLLSAAADAVAAGPSHHASKI
jgi:two-component system, NarL family, nitrate/nitrite response regulator NarL